MENKEKKSKLKSLGITGDSVKPSKLKTHLNLGSGSILRKKSINSPTKPLKSPTKPTKTHKAPKSPLHPQKSPKPSKTPKSPQDLKFSKNLKNPKNPKSPKKALKTPKQSHSQYLSLSTPKTHTLNPHQITLPTVAPTGNVQAKKHLSTGNIIKNLFVESHSKVKRKFMRRRGKGGSIVRKGGKETENRGVFTAINGVRKMENVVTRDFEVGIKREKDGFEDFKEVILKTARKARFGFSQRIGETNYDDFKRTLQGDSRLGSSRGSMGIQNHKFLASIRSANELDDLLDPSKKVLERDKRNEEDFTDMFRDKDLDLDDQDLENALLHNADFKTIDNFSKYLTIMLERHLKFNTIEEQEMKKRQVEDLDLNNISDHFISKKTILSKTFDTYINYKSNGNHHEAEFIKRIYEDFKGILEFFIEITDKLRKTNLREYERNQELIAQNNDFLDAMNAVKQMRGSENVDYYLFGIKRLTEQKYFSIMHAAKQSLKVANHELAYRQIKFLDDFMNIYLSNKRESTWVTKMEDMENEIAALRRTLKENKLKSVEELKNMLKFSDEQKAKIGTLSQI